MNDGQAYFPQKWTIKGAIIVPKKIKHQDTQLGMVTNNPVKFHRNSSAVLVLGLKRGQDYRNGQRDYYMPLEIIKTIQTSYQYKT
jgi:hypothetical protein